MGSLYIRHLFYKYHFITCSYALSWASCHLLIFNGCRGIYHADPQEVGTALVERRLGVSISP